MIEKTLVIIKPDALQRGLEFEVLEKIQKKGFSISAMYKARPSEQTFRIHYAEVIKKHGEKIGNAVIKEMMSGPVIVAVVEGNEAVEAIRFFGGEKTEPNKCLPGTIRHMYSTDSFDLANSENRSVRNIIHTSDSRESAKKEIGVFFPDLNEISSTIDYNFEKLISDFVANSNNGKFIYHGVKTREAVEKIMENGVCPLTPELSGNCSFWATGLALFLPSIDSPFFNYSGGFNSNVSELNIAITNYSVLSGKEGIALPEFESNSQLKINCVIPYDLISIINTRVEHPFTTSHSESRKYRQRAEQLTLNALISQVYTGFSPGNEIKIYEKIQD